MQNRLTDELESLRIEKGQKAGSPGGRKWVVITVLAAVGVLAALAVLLTNPSISTIGAKPREVVVRQSGSEGGIVLTAGGYIVPRHRVDVASKISGRVEDVLFEKGDFVKNGQVLARLDDREYRVQLAQATSNRDAAGAKLNEAVAGSRPQEIERARATVEQAEANIRTSEINLERARKLNRSGVFAKQAVDDAQNAYDVSTAKLKGGRQLLASRRATPRSTSSKRPSRRPPPRA